MSDDSEQRSIEDVHREHRRGRAPSFADYMDFVFPRMDAAQRDRLPRNVGSYVDALVQYGLEDLEHFGDALVSAVVGQFYESPGGERFILDPIRTRGPVVAMLFVDDHGALVSVTNPESSFEGDGPDRVQLLARYQSYEVLTGPLAGQRFNSVSRPLPDSPGRQPFSGEGDGNG